MSFPVTKYCMKNHVHCKPCFFHMRAWLEDVSPAWTARCVLLTVLFLHPPPYIFTCLICGQSYCIYTESWGIIPQYTLLLTLGFVTHWFSSQLSLSTATSSPFFTISWERLSWPFLGFHYAVFDKVPWLPRVVFQLSPRALLPPLTRSSLPPGHQRNHLIWVDSSLIAPMS